MEISKMKSNYGLGPRTGLAGNTAKRAAFKAGKAERSNLADSINAVLGNMDIDPYSNPKLEGKAPDVKPKKFKR